VTEVVYYHPVSNELLSESFVPLLHTLVSLEQVSTLSTLEESPATHVCTPRAIRPSELTSEVNVASYFMETRLAPLSALTLALSFAFHLLLLLQASHS
jgi:hypothetical protein